MKTMVGTLCVCLISVAVAPGEDAKKLPFPVDGLVVSQKVSIEVAQTIVTRGKETSVHLSASVKGNDALSAKMIPLREKPAAILVHTRSGGQCYYVLPQGVQSVTFKDWGLNLLRRDKKTYLDDNGWSWRLKEGEEPKLRRIVGRGTLTWSNGAWSFQEEKSKRLWNRVFFVLQN